MMKRIPTVTMALLAFAAPHLALAQATYPDANNPSVQVPSVVQKCLNAAGRAVPISSGQCQNGIQTNLSNPTVLTAPQSYSAGAAQPVGLDTQGGIIPATGLRTAPASCTSGCTTFGANANGVLIAISTWPYSSVDFDLTSVGSGNTILFEQSNDNPGPAGCAAASGTWQSIVAYPSNTVNSNKVTQATGVGHYTINTTAACVRMRVSVYGSGTITGGAYQSNNAPLPYAVSVVGIASNSSPVGNGGLNAVPAAVNPYPGGATAISASATGTTGAVTATLSGASGAYTYICGFEVSATGGSASVGPITISNLVGSVTFTYQLNSGNTLARTFTPCIPSSATNTSIAIATTADGTATAVDVNAWGYRD